MANSSSIGPNGRVTNDAAVIDLQGDLVLPGLVDGHIHLDKTLFGLPWMPHSAKPNRMSRIENDKHVLPNLALPARERAAFLLDECIRHGTSHVRTHVDIHRETGLKPLEEILAVRERYHGRITIQIVAFPQGGVMRARGVADLLDAAIRAGADLVGGIDPSEVDRDFNMVSSTRSSAWPTVTVSASTSICTRRVSSDSMMSRRFARVPGRSACRARSLSVTAFVSA